jgi:hypothetical protein
MDEHGGINEGVVTPADLLSFARQVAMAMVRIFVFFSPSFVLLDKLFTLSSLIETIHFN